VKLITAVIRPATFDSLKEALALFGVRGMTVGSVYHTEHQPGHVEIYRGQRFVSDMTPSLRIDLLAPEGEVADLLRVIGKLVDNTDDAAERVWLTEVNLVVRVRTGERGIDAL
jgi:nitrogen regulatory protein P-II 1